MEKSIAEAVDHFLKFGPVTQSPPKGRGPASVIAGAYLIKHVLSGKIYVGSSSNVSVRHSHHKNLLAKKRHHNHELQKAYSKDPNIEFLFILTSTVEEATGLEQQMLDKYHSSELLFNIAPDALRASKGLKRTAVVKEKLSRAMRARMADPDYAEKVRLRHLGSKRSETAVEKIRLSQKYKWRAVCIDDVAYENSVTAAKVLGLKTTTLENRLRSSNPLFDKWFYCDQLKENK